MSKHRVLLTDYNWPDLDVERRLLAQADAELVLPPAADPATLASLAGDVRAIITCWAKVPESVLAAAPRCKHVARLGIGLDNIDVAAATRLGMLVTNVPDYCLHEVAEHALALLLSLARKTAHFHLQTKNSCYDPKAWAPVRRLTGQTLGIVGLGSIGRQLAARAQGLGLKVLAARRKPEGFPGTTLVPLDELLERSDFVSLHAPLTVETRHLIGRRELARMKPTAFLINTSRGGLIDHAALAEALAGDRLAGAALDVQDPEPPNMSEPPYNDPRVIVTPHGAFYSEESLIDLRQRVAQQVVAVLADKRPENIVNPEVLAI